MGLFDKLTKGRMSIFQYALEILKLTDLQVSVGELFKAYTLSAQAKSYESDDSEDWLNFVIPEQPVREREFWKAYFSLHQQCFGLAQLSCTIAENKNPNISYAFYEALKLTHETLIDEITGSKESKEIKEFKMPPTMEIASEKSWMFPILDYLHETGNSKEHLEFFMTVDDCVEGFFKFSSDLEASYLALLNNKIVVDWEKFVEGKYY